MAVTSPQTNILFVDIADAVTADFQAALTEARITVTGGRTQGGQRQRWVTHLDVDRDDVESALERIAAWNRGASVP